MARIINVRIIGMLVLMTVIHGCAGSSGQSTAETGQQGGSDALQRCDATPVQRWVGREMTATAEAEILKASRAEVARLVRPGEAVTMDYRADRINLELDQSGSLVRAYCG